MSEINDLKEANAYLIKGIRSAKQIRRELLKAKEELIEMIRKYAHLDSKGLKELKDKPEKMLALLKAQNEALTAEALAVTEDNKKLRVGVAALEEILKKLNNEA